MQILAQLTAFSFAIISTNAPASQPAFQHLGGSYGSVEYSADVTCVMAEKSYTFTVSDLHLTLHPDAHFNKVDSVRNPRLNLITTVLQPAATRGDITSKSSQPLALTLDREHRTATVSDHRFTVAKQKIKQSSYTGLTLTDGRLLWPLPGDLKSCARKSDSSFESGGIAATQGHR